MRVSGRALVLAGFVAFCVPAGATAAPIVTGIDPVGTCLDLGLVGATTTACSVFNVDPYSQDPLSVQLSSSQDVVLLSFELVSDTLFSVLTTPFTSSSDGPTIGLFYSTSPEPGNTPLSVVTFANPDGSVETAIGPIISPLDPNAPDPNPRLVTQGSYLLALIHPTNFLGGTPESLLAPFTLDAGGTLCTEDPTGCAFSVSFTLPEDGGPAPVPEPGTLTLMAGGAIAGLLQRRRTRKRQAHSSSVSR
jgi:PEP-CTERM motif